MTDICHTGQGGGESHGGGVYWEQSRYRISWSVEAWVMGWWIGSCVASCLNVLLNVHYSEATPGKCTNKLKKNTLWSTLQILGFYSDISDDGWGGGMGIKNQIGLCSPINKALIASWIGKISDKIFFLHTQIPKTEIVFTKIYGFNRVKSKMATINLIYFITKWKCSPLTLESRLSVIPLVHISV